MENTSSIPSSSAVPYVKLINMTLVGVGKREAVPKSYPPSALNQSTHLLRDIQLLTDRYLWYPPSVGSTSASGAMVPPRANIGPCHLYTFFFNISFVFLGLLTLIRCLVRNWKNFFVLFLHVANKEVFQILSISKFGIRKLKQLLDLFH